MKVDRVYFILPFLNAKKLYRIPRQAVKQYAPNHHWFFQARFKIKSGAPLAFRSSVSDSS